MRKIVQIIPSKEQDLIALCDDGTVWSSWYDYHTKTVRWEPMPAIPQGGGGE